MIFFSQICTDVEQSERLIALGLKKETADMVHMAGELRKYYHPKALPVFAEDYFRVFPDVLPAWSLHRLIELAYGNWKEDIVPIYLENSYDMLIGRIEFQVKQGKFNKEYLV